MKEYDEMRKTSLKYDENFKKSIVNLHQNEKSQSELSREYGISTSAISSWIRMYSEVKIYNDAIMTAKQVQKLTLSLFWILFG